MKNNQPTSLTAFYIGYGTILGIFGIGLLLFFQFYLNYNKTETQEQYIKLYQKHAQSAANLLSDRQRATILDLLDINAYQFFQEYDKHQTLDSVTESYLYRFMRTRPNIFQLRMLDTLGFERVRIEKTKDGELITQRQLQDKSNRDYFITAKQLESSQVQISRVDYNVEGDSLELPLRTTLRFMKPLVSKSQKTIGYLILNVELQSFFNAISQIIKSDQGTIGILNGDGNWILGNESQNLKHVLPEFEGDKIGLPKDVFSNLCAVQQLETDSGFLFPILISPESNKFDFKVQSSDGFYCIYSYLPNSVIEANIDPLKTSFYSGFGIFLLLALLVILQTKNTFNQIAEKQIKLENINKQLDEQTAELAFTNKQIIESNHKLEEFSQILSHNIRSPLSNIKGLSEMYSYLKNEEEKVELIGSIKTLAQELDDILHKVNDVLKIKKELQHHPSIVNIPTVFEKTKLGLNELILEKDAKIYTTFDVIEINYPEVYLESILSNLISNAIKYSHPARKPIILVRSFKTGDTINISVEDNGIGIDITNFGNQIFELNKAFNKREKTTGFGLFLLKTQVESLGGRIEVESAVGQGSIFKVVIPKNL